MDAAHEETRDPETSEQSEDSNNRLNTHDNLESDSGLLPNTDQTSDLISSNSECNDLEETGKELEAECQVNYKEDCVSIENHSDLLEETETDTGKVNDKCKEETNSEWITVG